MRRRRHDIRLLRWKGRIWLAAGIAVAALSTGGLLDLLVEWSFWLERGFGFLAFTLICALGFIGIGWSQLREASTLRREAALRHAHGVEPPLRPKPGLSCRKARHVYDRLNW